MNTDQQLWGSLELTADQHKYWQLGDLQLWILKRDQDVWIGYQYHEDGKQAAEEHPDPPEDLEWRRWAMKNDVDMLKISPVFHDLPLVVHSEYPLKVSPGTKIQIYTRVPIWVKITDVDSGYQLIEIPSVPLSRTWFGSPVEGELCYFATTKARRDLSKIMPKPYLVACPILIINKSGDDLDFSNFCYRVERLSIYRHDNALWADETQIVYQGDDLNSDIIMTGRLPEGISKKELMAKPRKPVHKSLTTRTFRKLFEDNHFLTR